MRWIGHAENAQRLTPKNILLVNPEGYGVQLAAQTKTTPEG